MSTPCTRVCVGSVPVPPGGLAILHVSGIVITWASNRRNDLISIAFMTRFRSDGCLLLQWDFTHCEMTARAFAASGGLTLCIGGRPCLQKVLLARVPLSIAVPWVTIHHQHVSPARTAACHLHLGPPPLRIPVWYPAVLHLLPSCLASPQLQLYWKRR